jgi:hypothetical protein
MWLSKVIVFFYLIILVLQMRNLPFGDYSLISITYQRGISNAIIREQLFKILTLLGRNHYGIYFN